MNSWSNIISHSSLIGTWQTFYLSCRTSTKRLENESSTKQWKSPLGKIQSTDHKIGQINSIGRSMTCRKNKILTSFTEMNRNSHKDLCKSQDRLHFRRRSHLSSLWWWTRRCRIESRSLQLGQRLLNNRWHLTRHTRLCFIGTLCMLISKGIHTHLQVL